MQPTLLIMAAGIGSRYGGLKQVDGIGPGGEAILEYSVHYAIQAGFGKVVFVIRKEIEAAFREKVGHRVESKIRTEYAFQEYDSCLDWLAEKPQREKPWGTGHAILCAKHLLNEPFATVNADDFYGEDAFQNLSDFLQNHCSPKEYGMVAYQLGNTLSENGAVSRGVCSLDGNEFLSGVTERSKVERHIDGIHFMDETGRHFLPDETPVSMNLWGVHHSILNHIEAQFRAFVHANQTNPKAEFYIPTIINNLVESGDARVRVLHSNSQWYGVTYPEDKATVQAALAGMKRIV
ncbi:MAG: nucleotidyltransferase [Phycisphaerae bacterium]|nr:nucleotidyltransferase [Saprospiraceae bacterium]